MNNVLKDLLNEYINIIDDLLISYAEKIGIEYNIDDFAFVPCKNYHREEFSDEITLEETLEAYAIYALARRTKNFLSMIIKELNYKDKHKILFLFSAFTTCVNVGRLSVYTQSNIPVPGVFYKTLAAISGEYSVNTGRWSRNSAIKQNLVLQAETMWDAGSQLLHNEMADELLKTNTDAAKIISKAVLLAALKPIAAKRGKLRGVKGVRKK